MSRRVRTLALLALGALLTACAGSVDRLPETPGPVRLALAGSEDGLRLRYLGVGGWIVRWRGATVLTAPFFSNPSFLRVGLWSIHSDTARIDRNLPPVGDAAAILVGHAHYDHLMDVPYVARRKAPGALVYGSETMVHTLAGFTGLKEEGRLVGLNDRAGDHRAPGEWIHLAGRKLRFMALRSSHAPHFLGRNFYSGKRTEDLTFEPGLAPDWLEGQTLAFLLDLLDEDGEIAFRIYYHDAASQAPAGLVPELPPEDRHRVDLAILCPASFDQVSRYPEDLLDNLQPRHVLLGHWENFFRDPAKSLEVVPGTELEEFLRRLGRALPDDASWTLPEPGARVEILGSRGGV